MHIVADLKPLAANITAYSYVGLVYSFALTKVNTPSHDAIYVYDYCKRDTSG